MWPTVPRRSSAHGALVAIMALALLQMGAAPEEEKSGTASQSSGNGGRYRIRDEPWRDES